MKTNKNKAAEPVYLTNTWRIVDDPIQWILERRTREASKKGTGYTGVSFCRQRPALLRCIREADIQAPPEMIKVIEALPEWHVDRR